MHTVELPAYQTNEKQLYIITNIIRARPSGASKILTELRLTDGSVDTINLPYAEVSAAIKLAVEGHT